MCSRHVFSCEKFNPVLDLDQRSAGHKIINTDPLGPRISNLSSSSGSVGRMDGQISSLRGQRESSRGKQDMWSC